MCWSALRFLSIEEARADSNYSWSYPAAVSAFTWREVVDGRGDSVPEVVDGACSGFAQQRFDLRIGHRIEVR